MSLQDLQQALTFVRGVSRGVRRGEVFPAAGRIPPQPAPGGSRTLAGPAESPGGRGWNELGAWETTEHTVPVFGLTERLRVLHLSDVHLRGPERWVDELSRLLSTAEPDLLVITGDVVTREFNRAVTDRFLAALPRARLGNYAVIGNWEYWGLNTDTRSPHDPGYSGNQADEKRLRREQWEAVLATHAIPLLHNRSVRVGPIRLAGTDDALAGSPDVAAAYSALDGTPTLTLTHSPVLFDELVHPDVFAVLAGHTHAGQVRIPLTGPFFLPKGSGAYPWGWYSAPSTPSAPDGGTGRTTWLFVHRGIGWSVAPVRWRAPPEIAWIVLEPAAGPVARGTTAGY